MVSSPQCILFHSPNRLNELGCHSKTGQLGIVRGSRDSVAIIMNG